MVMMILINQPVGLYWKRNGSQSNNDKKKSGWDQSNDVLVFGNGITRQGKTILVVYHKKSSSAQTLGFTT